MGWDDFLTENPTFFCFHNKKDTFPEVGKSPHNERFVFMWDNSPPFARNPHTLIFRITLKTIKNEQATTETKMTFFSMSRKWSITCRSENVKKPKL